MKHLLLLIIAALTCTGAQAQRCSVAPATKQVNAMAGLTDINHTTGLTANRETAYGDTIYMTHIAPTDTITLYYAAHDSGFVAGMNAYGDKGFAESYNFSSSDSLVKVIGVISRFGGTAAPTSSRSVIFKVWSAAAETVSSRPTLFNSGLPGTMLTSLSVKLTDLGLATSDTTEDSAKLFMFPAATPYLREQFFIGYTVNYAWGTLGGDTVGLYSNKNGERTSPSYTVVSADDTTINNVNVTQYKDNTWHDNAVDNFAMSNNLYIFPVIVTGAAPAGVQGITRNGLTFYGASPNPAGSTTDIKIGLTAATAVSIELMDMTGNKISTRQQPVMAAGEHTISISTATLAAGDYIYLVRTGKGDGMAGKLTIIK